MQVWISLDGKTSIDTGVRKTRNGFVGFLRLTQRTNWSTVYRWSERSPIERLTRHDAHLDTWALLQEQEVKA